MKLFIVKIISFLILMAGLVFLIAALSKWSKMETRVREPEPLTAEQISWARMDTLKEFVRESAKDPGSIKFDREYYSEITSCVTYTGTNAYGGRVRGVAYLHNGMFGTSLKAFKKVC